MSGMNLSRAHATLGVDEKTSLIEVRARFRARARIVHPDRAGNEPGLLAEAQQAMGELSEAWAVIRSAEKAGTRAREREPDDGNDAYGRFPRLGECDMCGSAPAARISLRTVIGLFFLHRNNQLDFELCKPCGRSMFREAQSATLIRGWWGVVAPWLNIVILVQNVYKIRSHSRMNAPRSRDPEVMTPFPPGIPLARPVASRLGPWLATLAFLAVVGAIVIDAVEAPAEQSPLTRQIGTCVASEGRAVECDDATAAYRIVEWVYLAKSCGSMAVLTSSEGFMYCAVSTP